MQFIGRETHWHGSMGPEFNFTLHDSESAALSAFHVAAVHTCCHTLLLTDEVCCCELQGVPAGREADQAQRGPRGQEHHHVAAADVHEQVRVWVTCGVVLYQTGSFRSAR